MDLQAEMASAGVSIRELARRTGMSPATLSRTAAGKRELADAEVERVRDALRGRRSSEGGRVAWWCPACQSRVFLDMEGVTPRCPHHGPMVRQ